MGTWLYVCPACGSEATVLDESVGQTVQCPHCGEWFVASPPTDLPEGPTSASGNRAVESTSAPPTTEAPQNPAEIEPIVAAQDSYQHAATVGDLLAELCRVSSEGEVMLSDHAGEYTPAQLAAGLPREILAAQIICWGSEGGTEFIQARVSRVFGKQDVAYRILWSPHRRGWACDFPGAKTLHYFVPKSEMSDPPYCGDGMLVSLCKRAFCDGGGPFHQNDAATRCRTCLDRRGKQLGYSGPKKPKKRAQRVTLTKAQTETAAGQRLLQLISQLAEDRKLDAQELQQFRESIDHPDLAELAAVSWLKKTIDAVLADGYVTREEYHGVVASVLRVLPTTIREDWERRMRSGDRPATDRQVDYIRGLGGQVVEGMTVKQASDLIDSLLEAREQRSEDVW